MIVKIMFKTITQAAIGVKMFVSGRDRASANGSGFYLYGGDQVVLDSQNRDVMPE
jgi:hypothetical protein